MKIKATIILIAVVLIIFAFLFLPTIVKAQIELPLRFFFPLVFKGV